GMVHFLTVRMSTPLDPSRQRSTRPAAGRTGEASTHVQPFLKWAGGKRQLLPALRSFYPASFGAYFEPFVGSGAVFFDLVARDAMDRPIVLSDINPDVIGCYLALRRNVEAVVRALKTLAAGHADTGADHYYAVRDRRFNPTRARLSSSRD